MIKFVRLTVKAYIYLIDDGCETEKSKKYKKACHKKETSIWKL